MFGGLPPPARPLAAGPLPAGGLPAAQYTAQLQQMHEMGFFDDAVSIRALQATGGNVSAAVERLLNMPR